ncbi:hypothetical protein [Brevibacillus sp. Leaf182]|uniref:hypothetical protein n=1 Tax=Brevibacillus sp. Leaf182 TaxID=1736290 RepID=UPI0006F69AC6|nr:hypothetical protein [Brevibacillus sp. Leaf182]RAT97702.1 hypothetical protein ASG16_011445 [Brevibacillus sp. Leaf182]
MEIRTGSLSFPSIKGIGPRKAEVVFNFNQTVSQAVAGLIGTNFGFSPIEICTGLTCFRIGDHHLGNVNIRLDTRVDDDVVIVEGTFGVRDWSDNWDDLYEGSIQFVLLTELETGVVPSNLSITGVEHNQAIQFFRSQLHLDPATAQPDNSIGLVAGKNTVLRVYIDTQSDPTRPVIGRISGLLEVRLPGSGNWTPISPINGPLVPKTDSSINRRNPDDTLNFLIPGALCVGNVDYRIRVFDVLQPNQPGYFSGRFQNTLTFAEVSPLRVRGVGIRYTGKQPNLAAPNEIALSSTLSYVRKVYPCRVFITGFDIIDFDGDLTEKSGDGCGDGWNDLLGKLSEMRGDTGDVYYGLLPIGVPTTQYIGCGRSGVGAGFIYNGEIAAHEIGHAFGRMHSPCGKPLNIDPNYPVYDALPSGSIGEIGIDELGNVQDPAYTFDFMGYCDPRWVSPYTYKALQQKFPPISHTENRLDLPEKKGASSEHLFLKFHVYRGGKVEVFPSFHYLSQPAIESGEWTPYAIELRDCHNKVLHAKRIYLTDPHKDLDSARLDFYVPVPFHRHTVQIVFTCGESGSCEQKELLVVNVPSDPPKVHILSPQGGKQLSGKVRVAWKTEAGNKAASYLLRYSNDGGRSWRAVAPSMEVTEYEVDLDHLPSGGSCQFQVLATEGIRTGMAVSEPFQVPERPCKVYINNPVPGAIVWLGRVTHFMGDAFSPDIGSVHPSKLHWYSDIGGLLGVGQEIYVRSLQPGSHTISLKVVDRDNQECAASIHIVVKNPIIYER